MYGDQYIWDILSTPSESPWSIVEHKISPLQGGGSIMDQSLLY